MASFLESFNFSETSDFRSKIKIAIAKVATDVQGEAKTSLTDIQWSRRGNLATRVLTRPHEWILPFSLAVAADVTIDATSIDSVIEARIVAVWDDVAGVTGQDLVP